MIKAHCLQKSCIVSDPFQPSPIILVITSELTCSQLYKKPQNCFKFLGAAGFDLFLFVNLSSFFHVRSPTCLPG